MATNTTAVAKQVRLQQWAQQITDCQNRPVGMKVIDWCDANGIILPKLTTITRPCGGIILSLFLSSAFYFSPQLSCKYLQS